MDTTVPRKLVQAIAFILLVLACLGIYQGMRRGGAGEGDSGEGGLPTLAAPAAGAKTASALTDPLTPALTEAQVRDIARQEARAALGKPSAPASSDNDDTPSSSSAKPSTTAAASAPTQPRPASDRPTLQTPATPAPAQGDGQAAPLF